MAVLPPHTPLPPLSPRERARLLLPEPEALVGIVDLESATGLVAALRESAEKLLTEQDEALVRTLMARLETHTFAPTRGVVIARGTLRELAGELLGALVGLRMYWRSEGG